MSVYLKAAKYGSKLLPLILSSDKIKSLVAMAFSEIPYSEKNQIIAIYKNKQFHSGLIGILSVLIDPNNIKEYDATNAFVENIKTIIKDNNILLYGIIIKNEVLINTYVEKYREIYK